MAPENGRDDGEGNQNIVFIDTSLETRLATIVHYSDTVSDLKRKIAIEHRQSYPATGDIKVHCLKVKRKGNYYILTDLMLVKSAFVAGQKNWFLSADASRIEQRYDAMQHNPNDDQLALPWVTDSHSNDNHVDRPSNLSLIHGSPSTHQKIVPFVNQEVPVVDQLTSDDSYKKVSKNVEEDKSSNLEPGLEQQFDTNAEEKLYSAVDNDIKSKKRIRDVDNEDTSLKKRRKTKRKEDDVKGSEEDITNDVDMVKDIGTSMNDDKSIEDKSKNKDTALDGVVTEDLVDEQTKTMLVSKKKPKRTKKGKKDVGEKMHTQTNTTASEVDIGNEIPSVSMKGATVEDEMVVKHADDLVVDISSTVPTPVIDVKNIDEQKNDKTNIITTNENSEAVEKTLVDDSLVDNEHTRTVLVSHKKPKKPRKSKKSAHDQVPTVVPSTVEDVGEKIQSQANTKASEVDIGNDIPSLSTKGVTAEDEIVVKHADDPAVDISSIDGKIIEEQKNDKTDGLEKTLVDDTVLYNNDKGDELIVKEGKIPEPSESQRSQLNEEKETEGKHADNDAQVSKTSQQNAEISEKQNENTDDTKKKKRKKKGKKSAARNEEEPLTKADDVDLVEKIADAGTDDGDKLESKDAHISDKINIISDEKSEVLEKTLGNDSVLYGNDVKEVKIPESTESHRSQMNEETGTEGKHVDNDAQVSKTSQQNAEMNANSNDKKKNKNLRKRKRKNEKLASKNEGEPLTKPDDVNLHEKIADVELESKDAHISDELLMKPPKVNHDSSKTDHSDNPSKLELEPVKSKVPEETLEKVTASQVPKGNDVNSEVDISKEEGSHEIDFMEYFSPTQQSNTKNIPVDNVENGKDTKLSNEKKPKKNSKQQDLLVSKKVPEGSTDKVGVKDPNFPNIKTMKAPKITKKIDAKPTKVNTPQPSESFGTTLKSQKITKQQPTLGQNPNDKNMKKSGPVIKQLLNTHGAIFGNDDDDDTSANDNAKVINSDSSTRTPPRPSSSGESDSSIDSRRYALKRKEGGGRNNINSQSRSKNLSLTDILKSSSRFKRAKFSASQQLIDTESQPVEFVPESEPVD